MQIQSEWNYCPCCGQKLNGMGSYPYGSPGPGYISPQAWGCQGTQTIEPGSSSIPFISEIDGSSSIPFTSEIPGSSSIPFTSEIVK